MNVLLVEPDTVMARNVRNALSAAGHSVQWRRSAQTGIDGLDHTTPDVVVLEVQLGLHNGVEFLYEMRSYPEWQAIPVVICSMQRSVLGSEYARAFRELGVHAVLYEPDTSLRALVREVEATVPVVS